MISLRQFVDFEQVVDHTVAMGDSVHLHLAAVPHYSHVSSCIN